MVNASTSIFLAMEHGKKDQEYCFDKVMDHIPWRVCYWSRSRQTLWRKGESSGHHQQLIDAKLDCDGDAVLFSVQQHGPACHTFRPSCFYLGLELAQVTIFRSPLSNTNKLSYDS